MRWILLLAGLGLAANGLNEWRRNAARESGARPLTCAELAAKGPGEAEKIRLEDFLLCTGGVARVKDVGRWRVAWVPAVARGGAYHEKVLADRPAGGEIPAPPQVDVLVEFHDVHGQDSIDAAAEKSEIAGEIVRGSALDAEAREVLRAAYPGSDLDKCWIVRAGREPTGWAAIGGSLAGGVVLLLVALRMFLRKPAPVTPSR